MSKVAVVGAGVLGAAIGWRLAEAGHAVTLYDPQPGGVASPGSFAWLNASFAEDPVYNRLRCDSLLLWKQLKAGDASVPVIFHGAILWEQPHFDLDAIARSQMDIGLPFEWLEGTALAAREPAVTAPPDRALLCAGDGYGDPEAITGWFLRRAEAAGARQVDREVLSIETAAGQVAGVRTADGIDAADHVILAPGVRLPLLLDPLGLSLAMQNEPGLLARTTAGMEKIAAMLATPDVHIWQRGDRGFLIGADFGGGGDVADPDGEAEGVLRNLRAVLAGTQDCRVTAVTVRERPKPADGRPAIGPLGPEGLYVVSTHSGMTLAPVIAEMVAAEIGGRSDPRLAPYRPDRAALC